MSAAAVADSSLAIRSGTYRVVAQMVMPHLEENLRSAVVRESRCLETGNVAGVFPVLRHPSLGGCTLTEQTPGASRLRYVLACKSTQVATGAAWLEPRRNLIVGELHVTMGGKNMTFSQRIRASYRGVCEDDTSRDAGWN